MLSTIHTFELEDSKKKDRTTGAAIMKPDVMLSYNKTMGGVDLVSRVLIPHAVQHRGVKWYRKLAELLIDICIYNSYILWEKDQSCKKGRSFAVSKSYREEIIMSHAFPDSNNYATGPNPNPEMPTL